MMRGRPRLVLSLLTLLFLIPPPLSAGDRRFGLEDLAVLVRVSDPQVAPDGRGIVVVVSRPDFEANKHRFELVLVDVATGSQRVLTQQRERVGHPRWSPSGDRLAFLANDGEEDDAKPQIFVLPMNGGEARRITAAPEGVQQFAWRPDGKDFAYATADAGLPKDAAKKGLDAFEVGNSDYLARSAPTPTHIWLVPAEGGEAKRLTSGAWSLPVSNPPGPPSSPLSWSPDGRSIAFARQETPHFGDSDRSRIEILEVATGKTRALTGDGKFEGYPSFSPDGTRIAYWRPRDGDPNRVNEIHVAPAAGGAGRSVTRGLDRCLYRSIWMPGGAAILTGGNDGTRVALWLQPLEGTARHLDLGKANPSWSFWVDAGVGRDGAIAFTGSEPDHPVELYHMASADSPARRLTRFNDAVAGLDLGRVERIEWPVEKIAGLTGTFRADGVIIHPPGFDPKRRYPLVLYIHGGPQAASTESFSAFGQLLAARGWVVFSPNYRGSDNLGDAYQRAIVNDAGAGPGRDVMAGLAAVKRRPYVDPDRVAVSGWSYGGYMTTWLIGNHPGWKVAVAGASVTDLFDSYSLSDFNVLFRYAMPGPPWVGDNWKAYRDQSPLTYAGNVRTPTLLLATTGDARVPTTQTYKYFHALKDNGVETRFIAWPVGGHFPADPVRARDVWRRWIDWIAEHFGSTPEILAPAEVGAAGSE